MVVVVFSDEKSRRFGFDLRPVKSGVELRPVGHVRGITKPSQGGGVIDR